ncbi:hypothetical protein ANCDUO_23664 [Ancylostoma duodenale]|uniref:Major facilitator superfamily (MFS) profile domain-containing protein n=1 Tax=Ancylostoma duodenale TaxID=51022 RepID=A0A0C2FCL4_9BILA|nr:hypothetical protein ANCDUO_23664 [Ancylostoma duodenale]
MNISWFRDSPVYLLRKGDDRNTYKSLTAYCGFDAAPYEMERVANEVKNYCTGGDVIWDSGILAVSFFGTFLLQSIGFTEYTASLANCLSGLSGTLGAVVGTFALDRLGRRLLVVGSLLLLAAVNTSMMLLVYYFNITKETWMGWGFLALFIIFLFLFSAGIGPTAWFLGAELSPAGCRAKMQSMSVSAQYLSCFLSPIIYYPLNASIGPSSFLVFIIPLTLSAVYFHRYLPETNGRTTEEIIAVLNQHELKK